MSSVDELWSRYEKITIKNMTSGEQNLLEEIISKLDKTETERANQLRWELAAIAFVLVISGHLQCLDQTDQDFLKKCKDGFIHYIDVNKDVNKAVEYFKTRVNSTRNPYHKARLSYCIWELKREEEFVRTAIESMLEAARLCFDANDFYHCMEFVQTAYSICMLYNLKDLTQKVVRFTFDCIALLYDKKEFGSMIHFVRVITHYTKEGKPETTMIEDLISKNRNAAKYNEMNKKYHLQRSYLELNIQLIGILPYETGKKEQLKKDLHENIAKSHEKEGNERSLQEEGGLGPSIDYREAAKHYNIAGNSSKGKELLHKSGEAGKKIGLIGFKEFVYEVTTPELIFSGETSTEIYKQISEYDMAPPLNHGEDISNPVSEAARTVVFDDNYPVADSATKDTKEINVKRHKRWHIEINELYFAEAFQILEEENRVSVDSLVCFIKETGLFDEDSMILVEHGIRKHFECDYVASVHILVPQIEVALRSILTQRNIYVETTDGDAIGVKQMGGILSEASTKTILGREFTDYLLLKFTDREGMNVRNDVAHGLMKAKYFVLRLSCSLIYVLLGLTKFITKTR